MTTNGIVQKIWNFCHTLRDDGVGYGDYLEQITHLLVAYVVNEALIIRPLTTPPSNTARCGSFLLRQSLRAFQ